MASERFEILRTAEALAAAGPAWTGLWETSGALVFQSHAWVSAWWASAPDRDRRGLAIVLAWRGDALLGVLPLAVFRRRGIRVLEWAAKDCTDYADALLAPGEDPRLVRAMWDHAGRAGGFDIAYLNRLLPDAAARLLTSEHGSVRLRPNHRTEENWRVRGPWPTGQAWFDAQSKKTRQNYRRGQKTIGERGPLAFRLLGPDEPLEPVLETLAGFKRAWLAANGLAASTAFYDEGSLALPAMARVLAQTGLLHAFVLECDGRLVAVSINFVQAGAMMAFVTTYDPAFERGSPGMVLMVDYIRWSIDRGLHTVDFLCGDEGFKSRFGTQTRILASMMGARTLPGAAAVTADRAGHAWRRRFAKRGRNAATEVARAEAAA